MLEQQNFYCKLLTQGDQQIVVGFLNKVVIGTVVHFQQGRKLRCK